MKLSRAFALLLLASSVASADPSGKKWFTLPVTYRIASSVDNSGATSIKGGVAYSAVVGRTQAAFANWTKTKVTTCPGPTTWDSSFSGNFASPAGVAMISSADNFNSVAWLSGGSFSWGASTLGITFTQYFPSTGELDEADMALNNNVTWSDACSGGVLSAFNTYDYESVILHEAGHFLGLDHSTPTVAVMYPSVSNGDCSKRALQSPDITDVCTVYPGATGSQGSSCSTSANCTGGRVCKSVAGTTAGICTTVCTTMTCTTGYTCQNAQGGGMACLPQLGSPDLCKFCSAAANCSTGLCVTVDGIHTFCTSSCTTPASCGAGYNCVMTTAGGRCAPTTFCSNQCTGTGQSTCPVGYACVSGQCDPTGNPGDHCELTDFCKPCAVCTGDNVEAYCRTCCGGTMTCNNCTNGACSAGNACAQLTGLTDKVCVPSVGAALCAACNASTPCLNGIACVAGTCHNSCNPQNPGSCGACFDQGGTNGVCACASEISSVNQPCGNQTNGSFFACLNGLACVGTPTTCKKVCTLGNNSTCNMGEVCAIVSSKAVCVPGTAGSRCAACNAGSTCSPGLNCVSGVCHEPCNTNATMTCGQTGTSDCVQQLGDGSGVCACSNERSGVDGACGANPIKACNSGLKCIAGFCRAECNVSNPTCNTGLECRSYAGGLPFCQVPISGVGGGGGTSCVMNNLACTTSANCCSGNCASGAGTTICLPMGAGGGSGGSGGSGTGGSGCAALGLACTGSASCCSGSCASGAGGTMVCVQPNGTGGGTGSGGSGTGGSDGSGGGGTTPPPGCGCGAGLGGFAFWQLLSIAALGLRRRKR